MNESDKKSPRVSKAPASINPVLGNYGAPAIREDPPASAPDWSFWRQMPETELWKAVALSCGLEPRSGSFAEYWAQRGRWGADKHRDARYRSFLDRLDIATTHLRSAGPLTPTHIIMGESVRCGIRLSAFGAWAVSMKWDLPAEFASLAEPANAHATRKPAPEERPLSTKERNNLLMIIAALAKAQGIDWRQPSKAALAISAAVDQLGCSLTSRAIENYLNEIEKAISR